MAPKSTLGIQRRASSLIIPAAAAMLLSVSSGSLGAAPPKPPVELEPAGPWNLHYEDESCKLRRNFGQEDGQIFIEMTKFGPGEKFQLIILGKPLKSAIASGRYTIAFGALPPHQGSSTMAAVASTGVDVAILNMSDFAPSDPGIAPESDWRNFTPPTTITPVQRAAIRTVTITIGKKNVFVLKTGPLNPPLAAMDKCLDELVRSWGVDPTIPITNAARPKTDPGTWFTSKDYPKSPLRQGKTGVVHFRLSIDQAGAVTQCSVQRAVNESDFAAETCRLLTKRARLEPARDISGKPVAGYFLSSVRYALP